MQNSPTRSSIDVGSVIDETYTIEALIGRGGMGSVFLASHRRLAGKKVAIKMLLADLGGDEILARFKREADIASSLDHPNIVKVENYNVLPDGTPYIAYEFLQGESLAQRLAAGPLPLDQIFAIIRGVGSALGAAHRAGIVHRDLKPQNIFLVMSEVAGNAIEMAKVLDFGISKLRGSQTVKTQESTLLGTPQYMAPEQATGQHSNLDERTDIFALGAIVYEMLTGRPAFSGASIPEVVFKVVYEEPAPLDVPVPANVSDAIKRAMAKPAADRFPTVAAFVEALTGQPLALPPRMTLPPPISSGERKKITANEAFAQTMGSGNHGNAPNVANLATTAASEPPPSPIAVPVATERSPLRLAALVVGGAAIAAAAMFFAMHRHEPPAPPLVVQAPPTPAPPVQQPQPVVVPADAAVAPIQLAVAPDAAVVVRHPTPAPSPAKLVPAPTVEAIETAEATPGGDAEAEGRLVAADTALRDKQPSRVESLSNMVLGSEHASLLQRAHAHMLRGIVMCLHNDIEHAGIDLRALAGFAAMHRRMIKECHDADFLLDQN